ncbi:TetR/AcrR family transcriptional regulator [Streptomyces vulcanius]|uniref:TetR/AcrR family transcriptional regulator n=1 Tax=Streptomyces vulcanius TaxID=1441876 RepID=A0ABV9BC21_9ACTN
MPEPGEVGGDTLYRRFPSRERLVEATYRNETTKLCAAAPDLLASSPADEALRAWMDRFVDFIATKHAMADALHAVLVADGDLRMQTRDLLTEALASLVRTGAEDGTFRPDVSPEDVLMSLGGITLIAGDPGQRDLARRLLDLLMDSLRYGASKHGRGTASA